MACPATELVLLSLLNKADFVGQGHELGHTKLIVVVSFKNSIFENIVNRMAKKILLKEMSYLLNF